MSCSPSSEWTAQAGLASVNRRGIMAAQKMDSPQPATQLQGRLAEMMPPATGLTMIATGQLIIIIFLLLLRAGPAPASQQAKTNARMGNYQIAARRANQ